MFTLALVWAALGYLVFLIGSIIALPPPELLGWVFVAMVSFSVLWLIKTNPSRPVLSWLKSVWTSGLLGKTLLLIFFFQLFLNIVGALSPELSFDALWYHLTLPKLYLEWGKIEMKSGNLLPWGVPRLGEMWYLLSLAADSTGRAAKLLHLTAGLFSFALITSLAAHRVGVVLATLFSLVWYTMLSVGWLSTSAYVDLFVVFFVLLSAKAILDKKSKLLTGIFFGLAASFKIIFVVPGLILGLGLGMTIPLLPWALVSYFETQDFLYPLWTYQPGDVLAPLTHFFSKLATLAIAPWSWTFHPDTPISPVYLAFFPLLVITWKKLHINSKKLLGVGIMICAAGWFFPEFSNRYLLPGLAVLSVGLAEVISRSAPRLKTAAVCFVVATILLNLASRTVATVKFLPYLLGESSQEGFLLRNLNFTFGDFYDQGSDIANLTRGDAVLVDGIHNLFYANFPFDHVSWAKANRDYPYILSSKKESAKYAKLPVIYENSLTGVTLFLNK